MTPLHEVIINKKTSINPIWIMRQAGRYLPEFKEVRRNNSNFIELCLNNKLTTEITLQPIKRFDLDAAIIFSDILMLPYGLRQKVEFKKNFGPLLGNLNLDEMSNLNEADFTSNISSVYKAISLVSKNNLTQNKSTIGFVGAPWTLIVYMINKQSPKQNLTNDFFSDKHLIKKTLEIIEINFTYKNTYKYPCEPKLSNFNLRPPISFKKSYDYDKNLLNILLYADGKKDLIEISNKIKLDIFQVNEIVQRLLKAKLLKKI